METEWAPLNKMKLSINIRLAIENLVTRVETPLIGGLSEQPEHNASHARYLLTLFTSTSTGSDKSTFWYILILDAAAKHEKAYRLKKSRVHYY